MPHCDNCGAIGRVVYGEVVLCVLCDEDPAPTTASKQTKLSASDHGRPD
jgi:hypothetical protein